MTDEASLLGRHLRALTRGAPDARGLADDVAVVAQAGMVLTKDLLVAGVHFFPDDDPQDIGFKAIATNASDLIAKGVRPTGYLIGLSLPRTGSGTPDVLVGGLAAGIGAALDAFGGAVLGGDLTRCDGPLTISVTAVGAAGARPVPDRASAQAGDAIFVTGELGISTLGLTIRQAPDGELSRGLRAAGFSLADFVDTYLRPRPPIALVGKIAEYAHASMDISDGLAVDLSRLARASGLGAVVALGAAAPDNDAVAFALANKLIDWNEIVAGGDDYQALLTVAPRRVAAFLRDVDDPALPRVTQLGVMTPAPAIGGELPVTFLECALQDLGRTDPRPRQWRPRQQGYDHFMS